MGEKGTAESAPDHGATGPLCCSPETLSPHHLRGWSGMVGDEGSDRAGPREPGERRLVGLRKQCGVQDGGSMGAQEATQDVGEGSRGAGAGWAEAQGGVAAGGAGVRWVRGRG